MYRRFVFEGKIHESLECAPLCVRRKLDLSGIAVTLRGWQSLPREDRLSLCHLPVDTAEDVAVYREVLTRFAARAGVSEEISVASPVGRSSWSVSGVLERLTLRLGPEELGVIDPRCLSTLSEEERYALYKLSDPAKDPARLRASLQELGLGEGAAPPTVRSTKPPTPRPPPP